MLNEQTNNRVCTRGISSYIRINITATIINNTNKTTFAKIVTDITTIKMLSWHHLLKAPVFLSGLIVNAILAFFLLWAVRTGHDARVWLPLVISMVIIGIIQGASVMAFLCLEPEPEPEPDVDRALDDINAIPMFELELASSSESEEDD
ncbi:hypothetical protein D6C93_05093 [Aureobasidium pullulans]|nr:hypothetical protein D6C93_05093 [Aureobasidium pullulans]